MSSSPSLIGYEQLRDTPVHRGVTLVDLVKFRRLFVFLQIAFDHFCRQNKLVGSPQYYRSLVEHFGKESAVAITGRWRMIRC